MESNPLITIITPTYNCAKYLGETIDSVLVQSYQPIEYTVLDDGSTDNTLSVVEKYFGKLHYIRHANIGEQLTVNEGLKLVKGKYFMIVNADDPLLSGAVGELVKVMESHPEVLCAYPDWACIKEDGKIRSLITTREYDFNYMVRHHTCLPSVGSMFRSTVLQTVGFRDPYWRWLGDFDYWLRVGLAGPMVRVPYVLACWRKRGGQASGDRDDRRAYEHATIMRKFYGLKGITPELLAVKREAFCWGYLVAFCVCSNKRTALHYIWQALDSYPQLWRSWEFWDTVFKRILHFLRR